MVNGSMTDPITIPPISTGELGSVTVFHILRQVYPVTHSQNRQLEQSEVVIGREPGRLGVRIDDESSSRRHAAIRFDGRTQTYHVMDLNSRNGTFVNGSIIQRQRLDNGDSIRIGRSIFIYVRGAVAPGVRPPDLKPNVSLARALVETVADRAAFSELPVLIYGPTGAGKERLAARVHQRSQRSGRLVSINCGALSSELLGSELFGHVKGAFSGAQTTRSGLFAAAHDGTLFLDEIGELPLDQQPALLRACEQGRIRPVGSDRDQDVNVRLIAATHKNLDESCTAGAFRMDLLARLRGVTLKLPPLSQRKDEILMLFSEFVEQLPFGITVAERLLSYTWPENVRELKNVAEYACLFATSFGSVHPTHLPERVIEFRHENDILPSGPPKTEELEALLRRHDGNVSRVARALGVHRQQAYRWLEKANLDPGVFRSNST